LQHRAVVILAEPGMGKTILLRSIKDADDAIFARVSF
jgi:hypothetical protein